MISNCQQKRKLVRHAVVVKRKMATLIAFTTTIFFLCLENVKSFTLPFSSPSTLMNENTLLFFVSGTPTLVKRWKSFQSKNMIRPDSTKSAYGIQSGVALGSPSRDSERDSSTALQMALGVAPPSPSSPPMLDMKTSLGAFGGWYNELDPMARPPVYEDDITDYSYTFASPSDNWPTSPGNDYFSRSQSIRNSRIPPERSNPNPNPIRTIRRIARWVAPVQRFRDLGKRIII